MRKTNDTAKAEAERSEARRRMMHLDAGMVHASRWRSFRRLLMFVGLLVALVELRGVPSLRITYVEQGGIIRRAEYWSVAGWTRLRPGDVAPTCPLITIVPLKRSLASSIAAAIGMEE